MTNADQHKLGVDDATTKLNRRILVAAVSLAPLFPFDLHAANRNALDAVTDAATGKFSHFAPHERPCAPAFLLAICTWPSEVNSVGGLHLGHEGSN